VNRVKQVRIASCTFVFTTFFTRSLRYTSSPQRLSTAGYGESHHARQTKTGGSDPAI